ncbi:MAG TPA: transglycosylase family protein [Acidimicrobiales bacterium]|nr:transglycosylase family protein [Acidimicrobiales bacterium]
MPSKESPIRRQLIATLSRWSATFVVVGPLIAGAVSRPADPPAVRAPIPTARATQRAVLLVSIRHNAPPTVATQLAADARSLHVSVPALRSMWQRVAVCEVAGHWAMVGPVFSGIGFANSTWTSFGGSQFSPRAGQATRDQQIVVGMRVTGGWVPDQAGCGSW